MHTRIIAPKISVAQAIAPAVGTGTRKKRCMKTTRQRAGIALCLPVA